MDLVKTPWDEHVFGMDTYEINKLDPNILNDIAGIPGHFTIKIDPLAETKILHDHGFYYCGTLVETYCQPGHFKSYFMEGIEISCLPESADLQEMIIGAFLNNRFHRDFNIDNGLADQRYLNWLKQIYAEGSVFTFRYQNETAGFWGFKENKIILHALKASIRGKGLAKYFWSKGCLELFSMGAGELVSSIAMSNVAVLNLYASLGFKFRNARDIYHKFNAGKS